MGRAPARPVGPTRQPPVRRAGQAITPAGRAALGGHTGGWEASGWGRCDRAQRPRAGARPPAQMQRLEGQVMRPLAASHQALGPPSPLALASAAAAVVWRRCCKARRRGPPPCSRTSPRPGRRVPPPAPRQLEGWALGQKGGGVSGRPRGGGASGGASRGRPMSGWWQSGGSRRWAGRGWCWGGPSRVDSVGSPGAGGLCPWDPDPRDPTQSRAPPAPFPGAELALHCPATWPPACRMTRAPRPGWMLGMRRGNPRRRAGVVEGMELRGCRLACRSGRQAWARAPRRRRCTCSTTPRLRARRGGSTRLSARPWRRSTGRRRASARSCWCAPRARWGGGG
jgi:hypothetical protein